MPVIDLSTLVALVGTLDDSPGPQSAAVRLRAYLQDHVQSVRDVQAYTDAALRTKGDQYNKALQNTDFSVVLFRPKFMPASEEHPMKVHKNQWL